MCVIIAAFLCCREVLTRRQQFAMKEAEEAAEQKAKGKAKGGDNDVPQAKAKARRSSSSAKGANVEEVRGTVKGKAVLPARPASEAKAKASKAKAKALAAEHNEASGSRRARRQPSAPSVNCEGPKKKHKVEAVDGSNKKQKAKPVEDAAEAHLAASKPFPTARQVTWAVSLLTEARSNSRQWTTVQSLYDSIFDEICLENLPKYNCWNLSVYWTTTRVGLLQSKSHVLSFANPFGIDIGLPLRAVCLYARGSDC